MKAWILSDLHLEMDKSLDWLQIPDADVCICAGDILDGGVVPTVEFLGEVIAPHMPVVFVAGNHEFYRASVQEGMAAGYEAAKRYDGVYLLERDVVLIDRFRFVGATLWTDFMLFGHAGIAMAEAKELLNDYRQIKLQKTPFKRFTPRESQYLHNLARVGIEQVLSTPSPLATVVVTHHAPSLMSIPRAFLHDPLTPSFASNLEAKIMEYQPLLWVHGHLHTPSDYLIGQTRVICNPRGYPDEVSQVFNPALVVDLAELANG